MLCAASEIGFVTPLSAFQTGAPQASEESPSAVDARKAARP